DGLQDLAGDFVDFRGGGAEDDLGGAFDLAVPCPGREGAGAGGGPDAAGTGTEEGSVECLELGSAAGDGWTDRFVLDAAVDAGVASARMVSCRWRRSGTALRGVELVQRRRVGLGLVDGDPHGRRGNRGECGGA